MKAHTNITKKALTLATVVLTAVHSFSYSKADNVFSKVDKINNAINLTSKSDKEYNVTEENQLVLENWMFDDKYLSYDNDDQDEILLEDWMFDLNFLELDEMESEMELEEWMFDSNYLEEENISEIMEIEDWMFDVNYLSEYEISDNIDLESWMFDLEYLNNNDFSESITLEDWMFDVNYLHECEITDNMELEDWMFDLEYLESGKEMEPNKLLTLNIYKNIFSTLSATPVAFKSFDMYPFDVSVTKKNNFTLLNKGEQFFDNYHINAKFEVSDLNLYVK